MWTLVTTRIKIFAKTLLYTCVGVYNKDIDKWGIEADVSGHWPSGKGSDRAPRTTVIRHTSQHVFYQTD